MTFLLSSISLSSVHLIVVGFDAGFKVGGLSYVKFAAGFILEDVDPERHRRYYHDNEYIARDTRLMRPSCTKVERHLRAQHSYLGCPPGFHG